MDSHCRTMTEPAVIPGKTHLPCHRRKSVPAAEAPAIYQLVLRGSESWLGVVFKWDGACVRAGLSRRGRLAPPTASRAATLVALVARLDRQSGRIGTLGQRTIRRSFRLRLRVVRRRVTGDD